MRAPSPIPARRSLRYSPAHATSPGSTRCSKVTIIFETPPVEVMITTTTTWGCSASTSMCRMLAVFSAGADTTASRLVTCESVSVVVAHSLLDFASHQRELQLRSRVAVRLEALPGGEHPVDHVALPGVRRHAARPTRAGGRAGRAPPAAPARCGPSRRGSRALGRRRSTSTPPAGRCAGSPRRPCTGSSPAERSAWLDSMTSA